MQITEVKMHLEIDIPEERVLTIAVEVFVFWLHLHGLF